MIVWLIKHECAMGWMKVRTHQCLGNRPNTMHVFGRCRDFNNRFVVEFLRSSRTDGAVCGSCVQYGSMFARKLHRRHW